MTNNQRVYGQTRKLYPKLDSLLTRIIVRAVKVKQNRPYTCRTDYPTVDHELEATKRHIRPLGPYRLATSFRAIWRLHIHYILKRITSDGL